MSERIQVGWFNLAEARTFRTSFECAAWFRDVRVEAGRYPVYAYRSEINRRELRFGHSLYADASGTVTAACFISLFGGNPIRDDKGRTMDRGSEEVGRTAQASVSFADYMLAKHVASGELELLPGIFGTTTHKREDGSTFEHYWYAPADDADAQARLAGIRERIAADEAARA